MAEEFCYLEKRDHAYDFVIVEFDKRNEKEYMTLSARVYQNKIIYKSKIKFFEKKFIGYNSFC